MAHITIEYVILIPVLIMQIFLFPATTSLLMDVWVDSRRTLALQDVANHLGSTIQQIYLSLNHDTIAAGTFTHTLNVPPSIENRHYTGTATLKTTADPTLNSSKILEMTVKLDKYGTTVTTSVILGQNVIWQESTFTSNSKNAGIVAEKRMDGAIVLTFTG